MDLNSTNNKITVAVCSCDAYEDAWEPFSLSVEKYWPDIPHPVVLITENKKAGQGQVFDETINVSTSNWGEKIREAMLKIDSPYIFFVLEDQWPIEKVDQGIIDECLDYMEKNTDVGIIYLETAGTGGVKQSVKFDDTYNEIPFGAPYRFSCAPGIFRRQFLLSILQKECSAWEFERRFSFAEAGREMRVLELSKTAWIRLAPPGAINRGKWVREMRSWAKDVGAEIDYGKRAELTMRDILALNVKSFIFNINPALIVKIQNMKKES